MTKGVRFGEGLKVIPVLAPQDNDATAAWTTCVDLDMAHWVTFIVQFGALSSDGASCDDVQVDVVCTSLNSTASATEIDFTYRLSSAILTDTWGDITAGTSAGIVIGPAMDNMSLIIDVDPNVVYSKSSVKRFVSVHLHPATSITLASAVAIVEPRYPGNSMPSSS